MHPKHVRVIALGLLALLLAACSTTQSEAQASSANPTTTLQTVSLPDPYAWNPNHLNIATTFEQGGTPAGPNDHHISNEASAWYTDWSKHLCGADLDGNRLQSPDCDNTFYFALPCPDYDTRGPIQDHLTMSPWKQAVFKNQWLEVRSTTTGRSVFVQWEDVGPLDNPDDNDCNYVFGSSPAALRSIESGLDISPAAFKWLTSGDLDVGVIRTDWRFVDQSMVPAGPWFGGRLDAPPEW